VQFHELEAVYTKWLSVVAVSTLTPASLLSGYSEDASLLYELTDKTLVVEDMSAILELPKETRGQMFSFLRSAYNGEFTRAHGKGKIEWKGKFGMLCGATLSIEHAKNNEALLGERFLNVRMRINAATEKKMMEAALKHTLAKGQMNREMKEAAAEFLDNFTMDKNKRKISQDTIDLVHKSALALSRCRSGVVRDSYHRDEILFPIEPSELGTRLASQFILIVLAAQALGFPKSDVSELVYRIVLDSVPYVRLNILRAIYKGTSKRSDIRRAIRMSENPTDRALQEMAELGIIGKKRGGYYNINHEVLRDALEVVG
jgi:hypothetical protein